MTDARTTMKLSIENRERLRDLYPDLSLDDALGPLLDDAEPGFWAQMETAQAQYDALPAARRQRIEARRQAWDSV